MTRVMAQGSFDIIHPGHLHYLRQSASHGDELFVVVANDCRVKSRKCLLMGEESRRAVVEALEMVDRALVGNQGDIFETVERVKPDVITVGYDQHYELDTLEMRLAEEGFADVRVTRIEEWTGDGVTSSSDIKARVKEWKREEKWHRMEELAETYLNG